nr:hypothetical protein [Planococcus glaciei]
MTGVVKRPAMIAGNSSGGIIALWCAANLPHLVSAAVLEDTPVFSVEMPRFKEEDRFVYNGLTKLVENIGNPSSRDLANYFNGMEMPVSENTDKTDAPASCPLLVQKKSASLKKYIPASPLKRVSLPPCASC